MFDVLTLYLVTDKSNTHSIQTQTNTYYIHKHTTYTCTCVYIDTATTHKIARANTHIRTGARVEE